MTESEPLNTDLSGASEGAVCQACGGRFDGSGSDLCRRCRHSAEESLRWNPRWAAVAFLVHASRCFTELSAELSISARAFGPWREALLLTLCAAVGVAAGFLAAEPRRGTGLRRHARALTWGYLWPCLALCLICAISIPNPAAFVVVPFYFVLWWVLPSIPVLAAVSVLVSIGSLAARAPLRR